MSLATVSNGHGMAAPVVVAVPEENSKDALSVAVQGLFNDSAASSATSSAPAAVPPSSLVTVSPNHRRILNMYCRICGSRTVGNSGRWISILNFKIVLRRLHDVDVEGESAEMYPRGVCGTCSEKYKFDRREDSLYRKIQKCSESGDRDSLVRLAREYTLHDFWAHSSHQCEICSDLVDFEKPPAVEEMVREVERMRAKSAKRPPVRTVAGEDPPMDDGTVPPGAAADYEIPVSRDCLEGVDNEKRAQLLAMALRWLSASDKIAMEFLKQFGVTIQKGRQIDVTAEFNDFRNELQGAKTRQKVIMVMKSFLATVKAKGTGDLERAGCNITALVASVPTTMARLRKFEQGTSAANRAPSGSGTTRGRGRGRGRGGAAGQTRTIVIDGKAANQIKRRLGGINTKGLVIRASSKQGTRKLSPGALEQLKKGFKDLLQPLSRVMRIDVVRYILAQNREKRALLARVGIKFDEARSEPLCFAGMDPVTLEKCVNMISGLVDVQWAVVMAESIFGLMHPKDILSMDLVGIFIDPTNPKVPLFYRLEHETRTFLARYPNGENLAGHLVTKLGLQLGRAHVRAVQSFIRAGTDVAEAFIKEGQVVAQSSKKGKKRKAPVYYDEDIELMPPPESPPARGAKGKLGKFAARPTGRLLTPSILKKGQKIKPKKLPKKRVTPGRAKFNPQWVEKDDEEEDPDWGGKRYKTTSASRAGRGRPTSKRREYSPETIKRMIAEADIPEGIKVLPANAVQIKLERVPVPPSCVAQESSDPLEGGGATDVASSDTALSGDDTAPSSSGDGDMNTTDESTNADVTEEGDSIAESPAAENGDTEVPHVPSANDVFGSGALPPVPMNTSTTEEEQEPDGEAIVTAQDDENPIEDEVPEEEATEDDDMDVAQESADHVLEAAAPVEEESAHVEEDPAHVEGEPVHVPVHDSDGIDMPQFDDVVAEAPTATDITEHTEEDNNGGEGEIVEETVVPAVSEISESEVAEDASMPPVV